MNGLHEPTTAASNGQEVALVTGAAGGIGRAIVFSLLEAGWEVLALDRDGGSLRRLMSEASSQNLRVAEADVTDRLAVSSALDAGLQDPSRLSALVNAAGVSTMHRIADITQEEWDWVMAVNSTGTFVASQVAIQRFVAARRGCIVNVASVAGRQGAELLAHYSASKFAVVGLTGAMAKELGPLGIRVNAVCPGFIRTAMQDREVAWEGSLTGRQPEAVRRGYVELTPLRRLGTPEDVAKLVRFLLSSEADFITGQAIHVDGGLLTC
ncbi:MAG: SDR family NAD(P)-dependent oxidoreductase [Streptosporangiaceae bacterium]